ncbi:MAG TPA: (2Fe-2S)-binding protein [Bryobacteraceae bacterium]|nr:(2Fe-2S)-binding protein [Bryobacteraceae bacterium]
MLKILVNNAVVHVPANATVAAALLHAGTAGFRRSVTGAPRGPLCAMGVCMECRVTIDGQPHQLACQTFCREGMEITAP